jgi:hypothetical protein
MAEKEHGDQLVRAAAFFERAKAVAAEGNFDYAIDMYLEGLGCVPDALEEGHIPLCELAFHRQGKGGKKPSMVERFRRQGGKSPLEELLNAEYLFAKDPNHLAYAEGMLRAAVAGGYKRTADWIANFVFQTNKAAKKPSLETYVLLKDSYEQIGEYDKAAVACQYAVKLRPEDGELADELKRLTAEETVSRGKYDMEGDFRESIKDRQAQEKLQSQEGVVRTESYRALALEAAREALAEEPNLARNIYNLADELSGTDSDAGENEAIEVLESAYERTSDYSFKQRAGQIKLKQLRRKLRLANAAVN